MLIDCICGESKFAINAEQIGFDGRLVKCGKCGKEWFQESKQNVIEKKLIDLDQSLHSQEIKIANERNYFSDNISSLEKELEAKDKEIENQKRLEQRLALFESRVKDNESETSRQKTHNERISVLQKELEKKTLDLFIKNTSLEKRTIVLQEQLSQKSLGDRLSSLEEVLIKKVVGGKIINTSKPIEVFDQASEQKNSNGQQSSDSIEEPKPFEIDEIKKVTEDQEAQSDEKQRTYSDEKQRTYKDIHEDEDDTSRIGRSGDPSRRKKV